jgi:23S rRNA (cytidine1920-2'-O)/16S rRNA (cytidine1409-2'-O)-methyltransferase
VHDRTNIREIDTDLIGGTVDLVVGDLSFISLQLVLEALIGVTAADGDLALMVKPQFEVGKDRLGKGGVVRDLGHRADAVVAVADAAARRGWGARAVTTSPLPGPSGNVEFFVWLRAGEATIGRDAVEAEVARSASLGVAGEKVNP